MYTLRVTNLYENDLTLTGQENKFQITSITGLDPPQAQVNISKLAGYNGGIFNSAQLNVRNITITIRINGDVEGNRIALYQLFPISEQITLWYRNTGVYAKIDGFVNSITCPIFSQGEIMQISIMCPDPNFKSVNSFTRTTEEADKNALIFNTLSTVTHGCITTVNFAAACDNIMILNNNTTAALGTMEINYSFISGDVLTINSNRGEKAVTLTRSGSTTNIISAVTSGSVFTTISPGANSFIFLASETAALGSGTMTYYENYGGV